MCIRDRYCTTSSREVTRPERNAACSSGIVASTTVKLRSLVSAEAVAHTTISASVSFMAAHSSSFLDAPIGARGARRRSSLAAFLDELDPDRSQQGARRGSADLDDHVVVCDLDQSIRVR